MSAIIRSSSAIKTFSMHSPRQVRPIIWVADTAPNRDTHLPREWLIHI
jgi:hypothetical protein